MMNENNRVTITICGKEYTLQTDESPDYVRQLAARLDRRISDMMETSDIISLSSAAILVGLSLMDDSYKTTSNIDNIRGEIRNYVEEAGKARAEADQLIAEDRIVDEARRRANAILDDAERRASELSASCYHGIMDMFDSAETDLRNALQNIDKGRQALYDMTSGSRGDR